MAEEGNQAKQARTIKRILLAINCIMLAIGASGGPLISRLYFIHGGNRIWLSSLLQAAGFPLILLPLLISFIIRRRRSRRRQNTTTTTSSSSSPNPSKLTIIVMRPRLFVFSSIIGAITGLDNYLFSSGVARLPVSTSALILSAQLAFTALFAFLMVKQKFTPYSVNAIILLTLGAGVLALHSDGDRPAGESFKTYALGFALMVAAAVLYGFILPSVELAYIKGKQPITYTLVLEIQLVMFFFASLVCVIGMIINNDFKAISREARHYELGRAAYYVVLVGSAVLWQLNFLGIIGVIFCASSLLSGVVLALMVPVTELLAVIIYKEKFKAEKGVSLALSIWGFISYFYGEFKQAKKMEMNPTLGDNELPQNQITPNP